MPRRRRTPSYRLHKARNCGVVTIDGTDHYLGPYDSPESWEKYYRLLAEWSAAGQSTPAPTIAEAPDLTINELIVAYLRFARKWYVKNGDPTDAIYGIRVAMRVLRQHYGTTLVKDFGPLKLEALLEYMVERGWSRRYCNDHLGRIKRVFKWGKSKEMVPTNVYQDLLTVPGLKSGRTRAPESEPVLPVSDELIAATLPHLTSVVADMVRFQRATGARPSEVCILRPMDVDRSGEIWEYTPASHKTEHRGRERTIFIGPQAQAVLRPYLLRAGDSYCFSPKEAVAEHRVRQRANRKTKRRDQGQSKTQQKRKAKRPPGSRYRTDSYRAAIQRACLRAGLEIWSPNQLRHTAGTEARSHFGLEAAQVMLGHAKADVTQIYAERDRKLAQEVARKIG
jgi:integrase